MKKFLWLPLLAALLLSGCTIGGGSTGGNGATGGSGTETEGGLGGGGNGGFTNPGDQLGGGGVVEKVPDTTQSDSMQDASTAAGDTEKGEEAPDSAQEQRRPFRRRATTSSRGRLRERSPWKSPTAPKPRACICF